MEILIVIFLVTALILILNKISNRIRLNQDIEKYALNLEQRTKIYNEEVLRRQKLIDEIEFFLKKSIFIKPFAKLGGESVFKYILNEKKLYVFEDFMSIKNQKVGIDEDLLCFKRCMYKRVYEHETVMNVLEIINKEDFKTGDKLNIDLKMYTLESI